MKATKARDKKTMAEENALNEFQIIGPLNTAGLGNEGNVVEDEST